MNNDKFFLNGSQKDFEQRGNIKLKYDTISYLGQQVLKFYVANKNTVKLCAEHDMYSKQIDEK